MSATAAAPARASAPHANPPSCPWRRPAGATLIVHPPLCAVVRGPRGWFERAQGRAATLKALGIGVAAHEMIDVPIVAFLPEHPGAGLVLVDTGFHGSIAERPSRERWRNLGAVGRMMARMTHLHFDHASALRDFPTATVLVSSPEWQAARGRYPFMHGYVPAQLDPQPAYRTVDFFGALPPRRARSSARSTCLATAPSRSPSRPATRSGASRSSRGSREREALLSGDAVYTLGTIRHGARPWRSEDAQAFERSVQALAAWDREHLDALVIPGHDIDAWEGLLEHYS